MKKMLFYLASELMHPRIRSLKNKIIIIFTMAIMSIIFIINIFNPLLNWGPWASFHHYFFNRHYKRIYKSKRIDELIIFHSDVICIYDRIISLASKRIISFSDHLWIIDKNSTYDPKQNLIADKGEDSLREIKNRKLNESFLILESINN